MARIRNWIETRIGLDEIVKSQLTEYRVPPNVNIFYALGFVAIVGFIIQIITGFFLLVHYIPHHEHAFRSVQDIMNRVNFGWFFRLIHVVGSNLLVAVAFIHMLSVFFMGSYKKPRELTWISGILILFMTLAFCLSGYLLPWSQLSYWATTIVTTMPTAIPVAGDFITRILRGGQSVSGSTLTMFFAFHVGFIPFLTLIFIGVHIFLVRRTGISSPPFGPSGKTLNSPDSFEHDSHPGGYPFYPYFFMKDAMMVMVYLAVMFFIIAFMPMLFLPETTNSPADPYETPAHIKPEWYFLAPYQMLKIIPNKILGISLQGIIVALFLFWPLLDVKEERDTLKRPFLLSVFILLLLTWIALTLWGHYS